MKHRARHSLFIQVLAFFAAGVLLTGIFTMLTMQYRANKRVTVQMERVASSVAEEVRKSITEYPCWKWLVRYWHTKAEELDIEYDVNYKTGKRTEEKCQLLLERHPGLLMHYADEAQILALPEEDRKLYAEVVYSWVITRMNEIKQSYSIDYLFVVLSKEQNRTQFFLLSAADPDSVRGTHYEEVYPLGIMVSVSKSQETAMRSAAQNHSYLADAGKYVDYYETLDTLGDNTLFVGLTYNLSGVRGNIADQARQGTIYAVLLQILLSAICLTMTMLALVRPIKKIQEAVHLYKETKDSDAVGESMESIQSVNEIGDLADEVVGMTSEMNEYIDRIERITVEKQRISVELDMARKIQIAALPNTFPAFPDRSEFDIYAMTEPAREVGGDFYDYFLIDDDHLGLVMADVSGKGIPAAMFMMNSKATVQNGAMRGESAAEVLTEANETICRSNKMEMFVTVWIGILEISTGKLTAANAGHEYPVLKRPDGSFELIKDKHGLVIGGMEGVRYKEYELQLEPGAKFFLYTDGIPEATDSENQMFGTQRMVDALNEDPDASPEDLIRNVRRAVGDFVLDAEQFDDMTMMCVEFRGSGAASAAGASSGDAPAP